MSDIEPLAVDVCRHCEFKIVLKSVPTGKQFVGPFWSNEWVHEETDDQKCWAPNAWAVGPLTPEVEALVHKDPNR